MNNSQIIEEPKVLASISLSITEQILKQDNYCASQRRREGHSNCIYILLPSKKVVLGEGKQQESFMLESAKDTLVLVSK